jgi:hypothetical protein
VKLLGRARRTTFGISLNEVRVGRRGFRSTDSACTERLERIGISFLGGYHAVLEESSGAAAAERIDLTFTPEFRGFAFEGAGMALMLLDRVGLGRRSFPAFLEGPAAPHTYMVHIGAGWAFARLPWLGGSLARTLASLDPLLRWLAVDGYGFHEGYFHWPASIRRQAVPGRVTGYAQRAFDQGLGRSLWFVEGIDPDRVADTIGRFSPHRRPDLWSGVGLACAYAGGADCTKLTRLRQLAGDHLAAAAQGAAFAAEARRRAGNLAPHCDAACRAMCHMPAAEAAAIPREELLRLPDGSGIPAYEFWRQRIQQRLQVAARSLA